MFTRLAILAALATSTLATVFMTSPVAGTVCTGNSECDISWQESGDGPSLQDFGDATVGVYVGSVNQQSELQRVTDSVNVNDKNAISFTVNPAIGEDSPDYFIRITSHGLSGGESQVYSSKFQLTGMSGKFNSTVLAQIADEHASASAASASASASGPGSSSGSTTAKTTGTGSTTAKSSGSNTASGSGTAASSQSSSSGAGRNVVAGGMVGVAGAVAAAFALL